MRRLRRTSLSLIVWLTAATTLVAQTPHLACRCPNGTIKPFCLGITLGVTGASQRGANCCCNGHCCARTQRACSCCGSTRDVPSCCAGGNPCQPTHVATGAGSQVSRACCTRSLAPSPIAPAPSVKTRIAPEHSPGQMIVFGDAASRLPVIANPHSADWQEHERPPPTDLVVLLLHLVI